MRLPLFCAFALLSLMGSAPAFAQPEAKELRIVRISPEGEDVPTTRQIVLEFNRPVVPVGDMKRNAEELGITATPPIACEWRWLNTTALSCNLSEKEALAKATSYTMDIQPIIKAEDGATIETAVQHRFTTERPRVSFGYTHTWIKPGLADFRLNFNQPVTKSSVAAHIYFENPETKKRISIIVRPDENDLGKALTVNGEEARDVWLVTPDSDLPLNTKMLLKQEAGLVSGWGPEAGTDASDIQQFFTFAAFSFRGIVCSDKTGQEILLAPGTPQTESTLCDPMRPVSLSFTSPVLRSMVKDNLMLTPDLAGGNKAANPWGDNDRDWSRLKYNRFEQDADFRIGLPVGLKAAQEYTLTLPQKKATWWERIKAFFTGKKIEAATTLADEFGRALPPLTFSFATGHRNPNYEMVYRDAVLEKNIDSDVPLYVNNLKEYSFTYNRLGAGFANAGSTESIELPEVLDKQFAVPVGVRDMLVGKSGAVYANLQTTPAVANKWDGAGRLFAQVTPYNIYAKLGHFRSLVWVTDLASGQPVADATVSIFAGQLANLSQGANPVAEIQTDENGMAILPGTSEVDPDLSYARAYKDDDTRLFVRVDKGEDMALLPLGYDYEVQLWNIATDVYNDTKGAFGHMKSWGMTAQGIYRAGDTMQYKIYVRDQDNNRFVAPPSGKYTLEISDPTGKSIEKKDVTLSSFGTIAGEHKIPESAAVGWYSFKLAAEIPSTPKAVTKEFYPLSVLVSDFTPAPFRVTTELNGDAFKAGDKLDITANAALHSGGPFGGSAVRDTITLRARPFTSKNPAAQDYSFDSAMDAPASTDLSQKEDKLDEKGEWKTTFTLPESPIVYGQLIVENAVRDERGKSIASEARADYAGVDRFVGLKPTEWVYQSKKPAIVKAIVVDEKGAPVSGTSVNIAIEKEEVATAKVKSAGNAYTNDNTVEWVKAGDCTLKSSAEGQDCAFTPETAGTYRMTATIKDTKGRTHISKQTLWVGGSDYVQWNEGREYALPILPEKNEYKVGDTARYLVKNPYPRAKALITIERYGVMDSFVQMLEGSAPVIEIPVKPDYVPGFYVSIVAVSPRVDAPPPELGQIDMGKPAFRAGYVKTTTIDPYKQITVEAKADKDVYRPRDKVTVTLNAKPLNDAGTKEPMELAIAVLDESVFDLITAGRDAFDPYRGFYNLEALDISNYSLLTRLIGRQKFEKKGANPGGDGGVDAGMRNIFKYVSYWNPSVPIDGNGNATITFDAPDNLTGWRILALATTKNDLMGLGDASFKVNRPTEVRPVMPNQVREGDDFSAGFSVMNRTDKPRTIKVTITAEGDLAQGTATQKEETLTLEPYKRATVLMALKTALLPVTRDKAQGQITFKVSAGDDSDSDGLEHTLPLLKSRTLETAATYGTSTDGTITENFSIPKDIYTDSGDVGLTLSPSVIAGLDGAFKYMRDYPYPCWEQKLTMATMASHYKNLKPYLDEKTTWDGADTLTAEILQSASSYQAPNGGMAYFVAKDDYADPYLSAYTALAFRWLKNAGYAVPVDVDAALQKYLLAFLRNKTAPDYYQDGMTSTVRAVILAAYKDTNVIKPDDVLRFRPTVKNMSMFGKALYLEAANMFPQTRDAARETIGMILSSGVESGGKFSFNQSYDDGWTRILSTPLRDNCAALDAILDYPDQTMIGDKPFKLVRMITQSRGNRDHFENTQENMFCLNALADYARLYESQEPSMKIFTSYGKDSLGQASFENLQDKPVTLTRPLVESDAGQKQTLTLNKQGDGRYYYQALLRYAAKDLKDSVNAGIDIRREYSIRGKDGTWTLAKSPLQLTRGDLVKVDLYLSIPTARSFVAVNDPLPGALETVNTDLATASKNDANQALFDEADGSYWFKFNDWTEFNASRWSFYHKELRNDSARFYADWLAPGNYHLSYMAQAVATGTFAAPPVKAEEMYDPDIYGLGVKETMVVQESP